MINVPVIELWSDLKKLQGYKLPLGNAGEWFKIHVDPFETVLVTQESRLAGGESKVSRSTTYITAPVLEAVLASDESYASADEISRLLTEQFGVMYTHTEFVWTLYRAVADLRK